jgi:hypothetical protein
MTSMSRRSAILRCVWSTGTLGRRAVLSLVVLVSGLGCGTADVAGSGMARRGDTDPAVAAARAWLDVFSTKDAERLVQITALPFTFAESGTLRSEVRKRCDAMIGDTTRLERLLGCLEAREPKLVAAFGHAGELKLEPTDRTQLRPLFDRLLGPARPGERLVLLHSVTGQRAPSFELVLLLVPEESGPRILVSGLALDTWFVFS